MTRRWTTPVAIPDDLPVDSQWTDIYPTGSGGADPDGDWDPDRRNAIDDTCSDHLRWQLNLTPMSDVDRAIAEAIIDGDRRRRHVDRVAG